MQLFRFYNPEYLYFLLVIPVVVFLWAANVYRVRRAKRRFGDEALVESLISGDSTVRKTVKTLLLLIAFTALVFTAARPQFGAKIGEVKRKGVEIMICLDVSNSMLATDILPNRLERSKLAVEKLVDNLSDDRIGLIVFAGDAYIQLPVTSDYVSAKMFLGSVNPGMVPVQGTSLGSALSLAMRSFSPESERSKAIIIITDGEDHGEDPTALAEEARKKGIVIHTIGIGSPEGVPIPVETASGTDYLKDQDGKSVITKLNEKGLKMLSSAGGGSYVRASSGSLGLSEIYSAIGNMEKSVFEGKVYSEYNEQFQIPAALALLMLLADFFLMERKNSFLDRILNRGKKRKVRS